MREENDAMWSDGMEQLRDYLLKLETEGGHDRLFGVLAVGQLVQFHEWIRGGARMPRLHNGRWHLQQDAVRVQTMLNHILGI